MLHPEAVGNVWRSQCGLSDIQVFSQNAVNSGGVPDHLFLQPPLVIPSAIKVEGHCTGRRLQGHSISTWVPVQPGFRCPIPITSLRYEDNCDKWFKHTSNKNTERGGCIDQVKVPSYFNTLWWADCGMVELPHVKSQSTSEGRGRQPWHKGRAMQTWLNSSMHADFLRNLVNFKRPLHQEFDLAARK